MNIFDRAEVQRIIAELRTREQTTYIQRCIAGWVAWLEGLKGEVVEDY